MPVFFRGEDDLNQLELYATVLGGDDLIDYVDGLDNGGHQFDDEVLEVIDDARSQPKREWEEFVNEGNRDLATEMAIDLLRRMLVFDPYLRISAQEALLHPFFHGITNPL